MTKIFAVGLLVLVSASPQANLPTSEKVAGAAAEELLGRAPEKAAMLQLAGPDTDYLAFSGCATAECGNSYGIWLYVRSGPAYQKVWSNRLAGHLGALRFDILKGDTLPSLLFERLEGGSAAATTELSLYSVQLKRLFSIEIDEDWSTTPTPEMRERDAGAPNPRIRAVLKSWASELGLTKKVVQPPDLSDPRRMEQAWVTDNGHRKSGVIKLRFYDDLPPSYNAANFGYRPRLLTSDEITDGPFIWRAFFKAGVVGNDARTHRYFMVYLPADRYDWIRKLSVRGQWLYMSDDCFSPRSYTEDRYQIRDEDCTWSLRYNKGSHVLEIGSFDQYFRQIAESPRSPGSRRPGVARKEQFSDLDYVRSWVRREPRSATAHLVLGGMLLNSDRAHLDEAIAELRLAALLDPEMADAHMTLAAALMRKGEKQEALKEAEIGHDLWLRGR